MGRVRRLAQASIGPLSPPRGCLFGRGWVAREPASADRGRAGSVRDQPGPLGHVQGHQPVGGWLRLPAPPSQNRHTKHQRLSASLQECSDDRLEHVAEAIPDSEPLPTWERNQLQGVLWSARPGPWPGATVPTGGAGRRWSAGRFTVPGVCASPVAHSWSTRERSVAFG